MRMAPFVLSFNAPFSRPTPNDDDNDTDVNNKRRQHKNFLSVTYDTNLWQKILSGNKKEEFCFSINELAGC
jgi:hypothetical protein